MGYCDLRFTLPAEPAHGRGVRRSSCRLASAQAKPAVESTCPLRSTRCAALTLASAPSPHLCFCSCARRRACAAAPPRRPASTGCVFRPRSHPAG
eukprot:scaffold41446_cov64-Phaeocystis_antarctica.AAC.4